jgi:hypothetical protein
MHKRHPAVAESTESGSSIEEIMRNSAEEAYEIWLEGKGGEAAQDDATEDGFIAGYLAACEE